MTRQWRKEKQSDLAKPGFSLAYAHYLTLIFHTLCRGGVLLSGVRTSENQITLRGIAPFLVFVCDDGFKTVCQMKWVISITLPQSESIIPTTSERYSAPLCLGMNTKVDM